MNQAVPNSKRSLAALLLLTAFAAPHSAPGVLHPTQAAQAGGAIRGVVRNEQQTPIAGAVVAVAHELDGTIFYGGGTTLSAVERRAKEMPGQQADPGATIGQTVTDAAGRFAFEGLARGRFTLVAVHPEHGVAVSAETDSAGGGPLEIAFSRPTYLAVRLDNSPLDPSRGYIDLEADSPVANLQLNLRLQRSGEGRDAELTTGPVYIGPRWRLVGWGRNLSRAFGARMFVTPVELGPGQRNRFTLDLGQGHLLTGKVVGPDGAPLADVAVTARAVEAAHGARGAFSGADGVYRIAGLAAGEYDLEAVRHCLRAEVGCGDGPLDVSCARRVRIPLDDAAQAEIRVAALVTTLAAGDTAPDFTARTIDGAQVRLSDFRGRVVLLDFWATWCSLCLQDLKHIAELNREFGPRGLVVISISLDQDPRAVERFLQRQRLPWPQLVLGPASQNPIARLYNVMSTPTTMLIDRQGRIAARNLPGPDLKEKARALLD